MSCIEYKINNLLLIICHSFKLNFCRYHMLNSDVSYQTGCDDICAERLICNSVSPITNHRDHCDRLLNKQKLNYSYFFYFFGVLNRKNGFYKKLESICSYFKN